jgi:hypothetical protein
MLRVLARRAAQITSAQITSSSLARTRSWCVLCGAWRAHSAVLWTCVTLSRLQPMRAGWCVRQARWQTQVWRRQRRHPAGELLRWLLHGALHSQHSARRSAPAPQAHWCTACAAAARVTCPTRHPTHLSQARRRRTSLSPSPAALAQAEAEGGDAAAAAAGDQAAQRSPRKRAKTGGGGGGGG